MSSFDLLRFAGSRVRPTLFGKVEYSKEKERGLWRMEERLAVLCHPDNLAMLAFIADGPFGRTVEEVRKAFGRSSTEVPYGKPHDTISLEQAGLVICLRKNKLYRRRNSDMLILTTRARLLVSCLFGEPSGAMHISI